MTSKKLLKIFVGLIVVGALIEHVLLPYLSYGQHGDGLIYSTGDVQDLPTMPTGRIDRGTEHPEQAPAPAKDAEEQPSALDVTTYPRTILAAGKFQINAMVASTNRQWTQGLSGLPSLARGEGMWFVFNDDDQRDFWMPDMNFAIDIIFLDKGGVVLNVEASAEPETDLSHPKIFKSDGDSRYVLEVPAGDAARMNIRKGSVIADMGVKNADTK